MSEDFSREIALAAKISAKAESVFDGIEREMRIMKWPDEFKVIMFEAIADTARIKASELSSNVSGAPDV